MLRRCLLVLPMLFMAACSEGAGPQVIPAELVGTWRARAACMPECSLTLHSVATGDSIALVALIAQTVVTIQGDGRFVFETFPSSPGSPPISGTARVAGAQLIVRDGSGAEERIDFKVARPLLTLELNGTFDFNGDGVQEAARMRGVFRLD